MVIVMSYFYFGIKIGEVSYLVISFSVFFVVLFGVGYIVVNIIDMVFVLQFLWFSFG